MSPAPIAPRSCRARTARPMGIFSATLAGLQPVGTLNTNPRKRKMQTASQRRYNQSSKGKAAILAYEQSPARKARAHARLQLPEVQARRRAYFQSPEVKAATRARQGLPLPTRPCPEFCEIEGCSRMATSLDHCHITGIFRGWLCKLHNGGIGMIGDTLANAKAVVNYLENAILIIPRIGA